MTTQEKSPQKSASDTDTPWKMLLERYFQDFMTLCYPDIATQIDWQKPPVSLDKELHKILRTANIGKRIADKLFQVYLRDGTETWILAHIEIQNQREADFARRMYIYKYRIYDRYQKQIISIAILGDNDPQWRPAVYREECFGCVTTFKFLMLKLLDYRLQQEALKSSANPFTMVILAHLAALERYPSDQDKLRQKLALTRVLYERGFKKQQILDLYLFIDYMLTLPESLAIAYNDEIHRIEEEKQMNYITTAERIGIQKGLQQGIQQGIQQGVQQGIQQGVQQGIQQGIEKGIQKGIRQGEHLLFLRQLKCKFSIIPEKYLTEIDAADEEMLLAWAERFVDAKTLQDIFEE